MHALEKAMAPHSSTLAWRIPGTGEPGGLPSMGSHRVGHDWSNLAAAADYLSKFFFTSSIVTLAFLRYVCGFEVKEIIIRVEPTLLSSKYPTFIYQRTNIFLAPLFSLQQSWHQSTPSSPILGRPGVREDPGTAPQLHSPGFFHLYSLPLHLYYSLCWVTLLGRSSKNYPPWM